ncbi:formate dehydrogenase accessory sulfurtransferase FdhD [Phenylobacterium montanum]|uniref:Sulfur carrier protein FdhD n=1 Tax=Phenylobacterium montanum TaxID=2823693 RepID=A0A975ITW0_9CAUL|nr:formate dehydrogenase accessory sulfurtransferase FdhD [Caulobacter sp. S6]QUD87168.1 formate dehydrogenase accessory sulfurtransferase FdhD [Caulobacter sp. S6]
MSKPRAWSRPVPRDAWSDGQARPGAREVPEETPVALVYDASTYAVMMATPADLEDFAIGFSLTEGVVDAPDQIRGLEIVDQPLGVEIRMWLAPDRAARLAERRRMMAGPTGCGLCGIDSLEQAVRRWPPVGGKETRLTADDILAAMAALDAAQPLGAATRAAHAASFWRGGLIASREDVGRHNALDKLIGAMARTKEEAANGAVLLTSRVSIEMVQKTARLGAPILVAVSAPTALAVRTAEEAGITLIAVAREDGFEVFTHSQRISA